MTSTGSPARRPGIRPYADRCGLIGMGMARPRCSAARERHRPLTSSPRTVTDGSEWVKRRQMPCPHRTRTTSSAAARMSPSDHAMRCRQVPEREAKRRPWTDSLTPVQRDTSAADPKGRESVSQGPCTDDARTSSRRRAKCACGTQEPAPITKGQVVKYTRKQREAARDEAKARLEEIHATEVRVNDEIGSHITVFIGSERRVDWWPGARHWREGDEDFDGEIDEFLEWTRVNA